MRKSFLAMVVATLAVPVSAAPPVVDLVIQPQPDGDLLMITSATPTVRAYDFVLESTTDLVTWDPVGTNALSYDPTTERLLGTNLVQTTNQIAFYRIAVTAK